METKRVKLFHDGQGQVLCIPQEFELPSDEVVVRRAGQSLIVEPLARPSLLDLLASWEPLDEG